MNCNILYRGSLSSCNYACAYCPFAKHSQNARELALDRREVTRFVEWITANNECRFGVFFTPWGEALIRRWYQRALVKLSHLDHVRRAVIQTNLSCPLDWIAECRLDRLALWTTYHPSEVERHVFVAKARRLYEQGVRFSVGVVGLKESLGEIQRLRLELPEEIYVWVNAYKRMPSYYADADIESLTSIDPLFPINNEHHRSLGEPCAAGSTSFTVDGSGVMRRCHFVGDPIGNIYSPHWQVALQPRPCPNVACSCHIGYVYLDRLQLTETYGDGLLERIPVRWPLPVTL